MNPTHFSTIYHCCVQENLKTGTHVEIGTHIIFSTRLSLARVSSWYLGWYHRFCWDLLSKNIFWAPGKHPELWIAGKKVSNLTSRWESSPKNETGENRIPGWSLNCEKIDKSVHPSYLQMLGSWKHHLLGCFGWFPSEYTPVSNVASGYNPPRNGGWMGKPSVNLRIFQQAMLFD